MYLSKLHKRFSAIFGDRGLIPHKLLNSTEIKHLTIRFISLEEKEFIINSLNNDLLVICKTLRENGNFEIPMELYYCKEDECFYCTEHAPGITTLLKYGAADYGSLLYWFEQLNIKELIDILRENYLYNEQLKMYNHPIYEKAREFFSNSNLVDFEKACNPGFWDNYGLNTEENDSTFRIGLLAHLPKTCSVSCKEEFYEYLSENYERLFDYEDSVLFYDNKESVLIQTTNSYKLGKESIRFSFYHPNEEILQKFRWLDLEENLNKFIESNLMGIEFSLTSYLGKHLKEVEESVFYTQEDAISAIYNSSDT